MTEKPFSWHFVLLLGDGHFIRSAYILVAFYSLQGVIPHCKLLCLTALL